MKSAQSMQPEDWCGRARRRSPAAAIALTALLLIPLWGCEKLKPPLALDAPYEATHLWGVVPFANESGVSIVDTAQLSDAFVRESEQAHRVKTISVNRVIQAMRSSGIIAVATDGEARMLMNQLGLDGLIVGTVTAYDPYRPMKLGLAVQLYSRKHVNVPAGISSLDPRELEKTLSFRPGTFGEYVSPIAIAQASGVFDGSNHQTLEWLREYATGRSEPESAYGTEIYLVRMELFTQFACHRLLQDLLNEERVRLASAAQESKVER